MLANDLLIVLVKYYCAVNQSCIFSVMSNMLFSNKHLENNIKIINIQVTENTFK